jgi:uncharacterized RmlC-like cupin family protein
VLFGECLENEIVAGPGDCVYIPPDVIHYVVNEDLEPMEAAVSRTPATHTVVEYPELRQYLRTNIATKQGKT